MSLGVAILCGIIYWLAEETFHSLDFGHSRDHWFVDFLQDVCWDSL